MTDSFTAAEYHAMQAQNMSETQLQGAITGLAQRLGWLVYHTHDSRRSEAGYPDLHLVHPTRGISLMRELKKQDGRVRPAQKTWIAALAAAGVDIAIWRPTDWFDGSIERALYERRDPWIP